jgi:hypothetical protein
MNKHQKKTGPRFIQLFYWMFDTPAWKDLDAVARAIYLELTARYNGSNNGRIAYSARQAAEELKISKDTAARGLRDLQSHGFIVCEKRGAFHCKVRHASEYRLTIYDSNLTDDYAKKLCTKEFARWPQIQNSVPVVGLTGPVVVPYGPSGRTVSSNNSGHGPSGRTVRANN